LLGVPVGSCAIVCALGARAQTSPQSAPASSIAPPSSALSAQPAPVRIGRWTWASSARVAGKDRFIQLARAEALMGRISVVLEERDDKGWVVSCPLRAKPDNHRGHAPNA
jgi:hypothetical protein